MLTIVAATAELQLVRISWRVATGLMDGWWMAAGIGEMMIWGWRGICGSTAASCSRVRSPGSRFASPRKDVVFTRRGWLQSGKGKWWANVCPWASDAVEITAPDYH